MGHLPFLAAGLEENHKEKQQHRDNGRDPSRSGTDVIGGEETGHDVQETEKDGQRHGLLESLAELESSGYGQGDQRADHQDPYDPDGDGDGGSHQDGKDVIDGSGFDSQYPGPVFIKGKEDQLGEKTENGQQGNHRQDGHCGHFSLADGQDAAEQERIHIGVDQAGTDDGDGDPYGKGKDDDQGQFRIPAEFLPEHFDQQAEEGSEAEGTDDGVGMEQEAGGHAGQGRMAQGIPDHGITAEHQEGADQGTDQGNQQGNQEGIPHEGIIKHGRSHLHFRPGIPGYIRGGCKNGPGPGLHGRSWKRCGRHTGDCVPR